MKMLAYTSNDVGMIPLSIHADLKSRNDTQKRRKVFNNSYNIISVDNNIVFHRYILT